MRFIHLENSDFSFWAVAWDLLISSSVCDFIKLKSFSVINCRTCLGSISHSSFHLYGSIVIPLPLGKFDILASSVKYLVLIWYVVSFKNGVVSFENLKRDRLSFCLMLSSKTITSYSAAEVPILSCKNCANAWDSTNPFING